MTNVIDVSAVDKDSEDLNFSADSLEKQLNEDIKEDVTSLPLYCGDISLKEVKTLQKKARKAKKEPKDFQMHLSLDRLSYSTNPSNTKTKKYSSSETLSNNPDTNRTLECTTKNNPIICRPRGRSVSYLEQFRKKLDVNRLTVTKTESVCSTADTSSCRNRSPVSYSDFSDVCSLTSTNYCLKDDEESLYREIVEKDKNNKARDDSQSNSSEEVTVVTGDLINQVTTSKVAVTNNKIDETTAQNKVQKKKRLNENRKLKDGYIDLGGAKLGTLGPDIEETKHKLDAFVRRKEYGNHASCKNRLEILQRRETFALKPDVMLKDEPETVAVPVVTFTADLRQNTDKILISPLATDTNLKPINSSVSNKKERTIKNKKESTTNKEKLKKNEPGGDDLNTTEMLLKRHELEKKMAENIRKQIANNR